MHFKKGKKSTQVYHDSYKIVQDLSPVPGLLKSSTRLPKCLTVWMKSSLLQAIARNGC